MDSGGNKLNGKKTTASGVNPNPKVDPSVQIEFEEISLTKFSTEEEFYDFYNAYALKKGFSVRKSRLRKDKNFNAYERTFLCSREGLRLPQHIGRVNRQKTERPISRCFCNARLVIRYSEITKQWFVYNFIDEHNHTLASNREVPFLRSQRKINLVNQKEINTLASAGIRKSKIMDYKEQENNGYQNIGFTTKDLYNHCYREVKKKIVNGDAQTVLDSMRARCQRDPGFFYRFDHDENGHLTRLFWSDEKSRLDYEYFGDVLIFDSTFRTNRYEMSFVPFIGVNNHRRTTFFGCAVVSKETAESYVWLLRVFLLSICQKYPKTVLTDSDKAMKKAIAIVFPNVTHRTCCWHVKGNVPKNLRKQSEIAAFKHLIFAECTPSEFDEKWGEFQVEAGLIDYPAWCDEMYRERHLWAEAFFKGKTLLGIKSTQRSESFNALLHRYLDRKMLIQDLACHYEICLARARRNEAEDDCRSNQSRPYVAPNAHPLVVHASKIYTHNLFVLVHEEIEKANELKFATDNVQGNYHRYMLVDTKKLVGFAFVHIELHNPDPKMSCSCLNLKSKCYPCSHMFHVMIHLNLDSIPSCCIYDRWTITRRYCLPDNLSSKGSIDDGTSRYQDLLKTGKRLFLCASKCDSLYLHVKGLLSDCLNSKMKALAIKIQRVDLNRECREEVIIEESEDELDRVLNPLHSNSKGAPKKRPKSFIEKIKKKYHCRACGRPNHQARSCPFSNGVELDLFK